MNPATASPRHWIQAPVPDTLFFGYGWLAVLLPLVWFPHLFAPVVLVVLLFNYVHRHYTFVLVYGEPEVFRRDREVYLLLPLLAAMVTYLFAFFDAFRLLLTFSVLWTIFHSVAQKFGIMRVYSRKAGYGEAWIEKGLVYAWFAVVSLGVAEQQRSALLEYTSGQVILSVLGNYLAWMTTASYLAGAVAVYFTAAYVRQEIKNRDRFSYPKNLYILSILGLYGIFFHSLVVGYVVFAFSHAVEYIAFVNLFVAAKYKKRPDLSSALAFAARKLWLFSASFAVLVVVLCLIARTYDQDAFLVYIVGSSFLHFVYDAMIWKVRRPEVGEPLGIKYAQV